MRCVVFSSVYRGGERDDCKAVVIIRVQERFWPMVARLDALVHVYWKCAAFQELWTAWGCGRGLQLGTALVGEKRNGIEREVALLCCSKVGTWLGPIRILASKAVLGRSVQVASENARERNPACV